LLTFLLVSVNSFTGYAETDPEILESRKCSNAFSYFEKRNKIPKDTLYSISSKETRKAYTKHGIGISWP
jgi:hypothetical protein